MGVEAESGGEVFTIGAERVVLSSGALRSPQLLMLSGIGPREHLEEVGIPVVRDLPGVGQSLFNHMSVHINFKVKDDVELPADLDAPHYRLIFTAPDSEIDHDLVLSTVNVVDEREERVPGFRTSYRTGDVSADRAARISCTLGVPRGSGPCAAGLRRSVGAALVQLPLPAAPRGPAPRQGGHPVSACGSWTPTPTATSWTTGLRPQTRY